MIDPFNPDFTNSPASVARPAFDYLPVNPLAAPAVSLVTPFYNTGSEFHETARSVLRQSFQQWEWLIINDGSEDPLALAVLEGYRGADPRVRVIDLGENQGLPAARNRGFLEAGAEFVVILDSDDLLEPTALEKWYWFLQSYPEWSFVQGYSVGFGAQEYLWTKGFKDGANNRDENGIDHTSMVRKAVHQSVGGFDPAIRAGMEDWEFWLRCANSGFWGDTIPEYLSWYRRCADHSQKWANFQPEKAAAFLSMLHQRYPRLWENTSRLPPGGFPVITPRWHMPFDPIPDELPCTNALVKNKPRLLMILPWLMWGGADKFNLELVRRLAQNRWEISIVTTLKSENVWLPEFYRWTTDIFMLGNFLRLVDYPRFLSYLITSRQPDAVMISHSRLGYQLLPYLHAHFPDLVILDYNHAVAPDWNNGGYPWLSVQSQEWLDLSVTASQQVKDWMIKRGADGKGIEVCTINIDCDDWRPDPHQRRCVRLEMGIDEQVPLILYTARLTRNKQPLVFARVMQQLKQEGLLFSAVAAGDGEEYANLKTFIHENDLDAQVFLPGFVPSQRIRQLMSAADIFFLPTQWEGIALSLYEAMACGLAVVSADVGGQAELVTPECGILLHPSGEDQEVAQYTEILADLLRHPEKRLRLGKAGRKRVAHYFRLEEMIQRMQSLIREAQEKHRNNPPPPISLRFGRFCALQAMEFTRLQGVADELWREREDARLKKTPHHQGNLLSEVDVQWLSDLAEKRQEWIEQLLIDKQWLETQWHGCQQTLEHIEKTRWMRLRGWLVKYVVIPFKIVFKLE